MKNRIKKNLVIVLIVVAIVSGYIVKSQPSLEVSPLFLENVEALARGEYWKIQCKLPPKTKRFCPLVLK